MSIFYSFPKKYHKSFKVTRRRPADIRFSESYNFPVLNYADYCGDTVIRAYRDLIIDEGITVTTDNPCKGLYIYCDGDCIINGTLSMTARGAKFDPSGVDVGCRPKGEAFCSIEVTYPYNIEQLEDYIRKYINSISEFGIPTMAWPSYLINNIYSIPLGEEDLAAIPAVGADGAPKITQANKNVTGQAGSNGTNRQSGGGGGGGGYQNSSRGGKGTAYSGGAGGGGGGYSYDPTPNDIGGAGTDGWHPTSSTQGGGGAGNPNGAGGIKVADGTGGLIILVVRGNLTIGANGIIESKGIDGNSGKGTTDYGSGGGGSGGGSINIFYQGTYTKTGQVLATGGAGGLKNSSTNSRDGGKGGDGCITEQQI
ncbi:hypothetical protein [Lentilactobacillus sp.]|uniref:hypothetical protein n=1 Tax=Lentilactobacillus sp. TaxID=2767931 RepID=UPI00345EDB90